MKRFRRAVFNMLAMLSLVLCVATAVLWVRSYWVQDVVSNTRYYPLDGHGVGSDWIPKLPEHYHDIPTPIVIVRFVMVHTIRGEFLILQHWGRENILFTYAGWDLFHIRVKEPIQSQTMHLGFLWERVVRSDSNMLYVGIPLWTVFVLTAVLPGYWFIGFGKVRRARWRRQNNRCVSCGYDLVETPERCPECGAKVDGAAAVGRG